MPRGCGESIPWMPSRAVLRQLRRGAMRPESRVYVHRIQGISMATRIAAHAWRRALIIGAALSVSSTSHAVLGIDSPWCMGDGGGTFLCTRGADRQQLIAKTAADTYEAFVRQAFNAPTIRVIPATDEAPLQTWHGGGGGLNLYRGEMTIARQRILEAAEDWFVRFCKAKNGAVYNYPIQDDVELVNVRRLGCHGKRPGETLASGELPLFGIEISPADKFASDQPKTPLLIFKHWTTGEALRAHWGYPRKFRVGDQTSEGLLTEIKPPLAKVQSPAGEKWIRLIDLAPANSK